MKTLLKIIPLTKRISCKLLLKTRTMEKSTLKNKWFMILSVLLKKDVKKEDILKIFGKEYITVILSLLHKMKQKNIQNKEISLYLTWFIQTQMLLFKSFTISAYLLRGTSWNSYVNNCKISLFSICYTFKIWSSAGKSSAAYILCTFTIFTTSNSASFKNSSYCSHHYYFSKKSLATYHLFIKCITC